MTFLKFALKMAADTLRRGWRALAPHLRKWSVQIAGIELMAVYPILFSLVGFVDTRMLLGIAAGMAAIKFLAGFFAQKRVATYDPTTYRLVKIVQRTPNDE